MIRTGTKLTALMAILLAGLASTARGDDVEHLPNGTSFLLSIDVGGFFKSKLFQEFKKQSPKIAREVEGDSTGGDAVLNLPLTNIARITGSPPDFVVITTIKPVTAASVQMAEKLPKGFGYEAVKVGGVTAYMDKDRIDDPGKGSLGKSFCVVGDKTILATITPEHLRKVLERKNKPELSERFKKTLDQVGLGDTLTIVVDCQKSTQGEILAEMIRGDDDKTFAGLKDVAGKVQIVTLTVNVADDIKAKASAVCADDASAAAIKKSLTSGLVNFRKLLGEDDKVSPKERELFSGLRKAIDAVKLSTKGPRVEAELVLDAATSLQIVGAFFELTANKQPPVKEPPPR